MKTEILKSQPLGHQESVVEALWLYLGICRLPCPPGVSRGDRSGCGVAHARGPAHSLSFFWVVATGCAPRGHMARWVFLVEVEEGAFYLEFCSQLNTTGLVISNLSVSFQHTLVSSTLSHSGKGGDRNSHVCLPPYGSGDQRGGYPGDTNKQSFIHLFKYSPCTCNEAGTEKGPGNMRNKALVLMMLIIQSGKQMIKELLPK